MDPKLWILWTLVTKGNWQLLDRIVQNFKMHCFGNWIWCVVFQRFVLFRCCLDAEMKNGVREGLHIKCKRRRRSLWASKKKQQSGRSELIKCVLIGMFIKYQNTCTWLKLQADWVIITWIINEFEKTLWKFVTTGNFLTVNLSSFILFFFQKHKCCPSFLSSSKELKFLWTSK